MGFLGMGPSYDDSCTKRRSISALRAKPDPPARPVESQKGPYRRCWQVIPLPNAPQSGVDSSVDRLEVDPWLVRHGPAPGSAKHSKGNWFHRLLHRLFGWTMSKDAEVLKTYSTPTETRLGQRDGHSVALDVLIWNVQKASDEDFSREFSRLAGRSDLVLSQEASSGESMGEVLRSSDKGWVMAQSFSDEGETNGVATGARAKPLRTEFVRSKAREPFVHTPKMSLVSEFKLKGSAKNLLVINVHGINFANYASAFATQLEQLEQSMIAHEGPMLLAGDFNTWNGTREKALNELVARHGLEAAPFGEGRKSVFGHPLDHAFVRGLEVESAEVLECVDASDHEPLWLRLRCKSTSERPSALLRKRSRGSDQRNKFKIVS